MPSNLGAKDLPEWICANVNHTALVLTDPSRERSHVLMQFAKPIPIALLYDSAATALDDSTKGTVKDSEERICILSS